MQLKDYQENAIEELLAKAKKLLSYEGNKKLVFKSPTGSGKTIMMAEFLKQLVDDRDIKDELAFIWTAPRKLHEQSKDKLENYYQASRALKCSSFEDLDDRQISENEILFFNWESINKKDNVYIRENERENNLSNILNRTKEAGRKIILIIDESHHHAESDISKDLIKMMGPELTIEVSATPKMINPDELVNVPLEIVKAEGMIKKAVIINESMKNSLKRKKIVSELSKGSEEMVLDLAIQKSKKIKKAYQKEGSIINPLILIQLPDRKSKIEDEIKDRIIQYLEAKHNISITNGKLAIYLSENKENLENITKNQSKAEILIFKQAIALGWDCPRAQILVLFRFWKSLSFSVQTVGRIMRMPELKHYKNHTTLNYAYVYTNIEDISIQEDIAPDYITAFSSERIKKYKLINLTSCYSKRYRETTRLSPEFIRIFLKITKHKKLKDQIKMKMTQLDQEFIDSAELEDIDIQGKRFFLGEKRAKYIASLLDLQKLFDYFARESLSPDFYPEERSIGRIKESIYKFFGGSFGLTYDDEEKIVRTLLDEKNIDKFKKIINLSKEKYIEKISQRAKELEFIADWNIPETLTFNEKYYRKDQEKSVMQPFYASDKFSGPENAFIKFLEKSKKVKWWFKNGDRDAVFFAVPYENGDKKPFYVDFIIKLIDGKIGLFDTKSGYTLKIAGSKIDGLRKYIKQENKKGKKLFGGIAIKHHERWIYFDKILQNLKNNFENWESLGLQGNK